jgi:hypothetical protein
VDLDDIADDFQDLRVTDHRVMSVQSWSSFLPFRGPWAAIPERN